MADLAMDLTDKITNMDNVKRYECGNGEGMFDNKKGYWVAYEDYNQLLDKYTKLMAKSDIISGVISKGFDIYGYPIEGLTKGYEYEVLQEDTDEIIVINDLSQRKAYQKNCFEDC